MLLSREVTVAGRVVGNSARVFQTREELDHLCKGLEAVYGVAPVITQPFRKLETPFTGIDLQKWLRGYRHLLPAPKAIQGGSLHASRAALENHRPLGIPQPTKRDAAAQEPKIQGNLEALAGGKTSAALLRCRETDLYRVIALRSREDYPLFEKARQEGATRPTSTGLFDT